jgi:hypothetical protein
MPFEGQCKCSSSGKPSSRRIRIVTQQKQTTGWSVEDLGVLLPSNDRNEALGLTLPEALGAAQLPGTPQQDGIED